MRFVPTAFAGMIILAALAGCTDSGGKGAISGLLIDDRFRPLAGGLVLLQPVGLTATTNADGEFVFVDIDPGQYTARATLEGHEAAPEQVNVVVGEWTELNLDARRVFSQGSTVVTAEYSIFIPCAASVPVTAVTHGYCFYDLSGDTYRPGLRNLNFTGEKNVTYALFEMKVNQQGNFELVVRHDNGSPSGGENYGRDRTDEASYAKVILQYVPEDAVDPQPYQANMTHWNNTKMLAALLFYLGEGGDQLREAGCAAPESPVPVPALPGTPVTNPTQPNTKPTCRNFFGVGHAQAIRAQIVISLFLGEPEQPVESYQVLNTT